jgi:hypothetical protein
MREWGGTEWQDFCIELLRIRYSNHDLVEVPDRHNGDLGLEAFTHTGVAFQCYAAEEPLKTNDLYINQRDKLSEDLGKLQKNRARLSALFNGVSVHRYVFLVPRHDSKELVIHAQRKAAQVREWELPFIRDDFAITVETDDHYAQERNAMLAVHEHLVPLSPVTEASRTSWEDENLDLLGDARGKLASLGLHGAGLDRYLDQLSNQFLLGENGLSALRSKYPGSWQAVSSLKSDKEEMLSLEYPPGSTTTGSEVNLIVKALTEEIRQEVSSISPKLARTFAWSMVADWILRCPLDFRESA